VIGTAGHRQRRMAFHTSNLWPAPPGFHQVQPLEPAGERAQTRSLPISGLKLRLQLFGPPIRTFFAQPLQSLNPSGLQLPRHSSGTARAVAQRGPSALDKTPLPLVRGLAADAENPAPMLNRLFLPEQCLHQAASLPNDRSNVPRHDRGKPPLLQKKCHPCLVSKLSPMCWHRAVRGFRLISKGNILQSPK
jgi:hypothetical protein